jgi:thiol-disulfide isomerase/thioredoxin
MMDNRKKIAGIAVGIVLLVVAGVLLVNQDGRSASNLENVGTSVGDVAPDFTGETLDGKLVTLSELRGKVVLLNVFASWCAPCLLETPHLVEAAGAYGDELVIVGLNLQESDETVANYRDEFGVPYPLVMDPEGEIIDIYTPIGLPTSWFIDPQGTVSYVHTGPMTIDQLDDAFAEAQGGG